MPKYIVTWNCGYGEVWDLVEAQNIETANKLAYECWREDAEQSAEYGAQEFTLENAENYGYAEQHPDYKED